MPVSPSTLQSGDRNLLRCVGGRIRECRKAVGISQEELADRCALNRSYMGAVERGERNVGLLNFLRIAGALGVQPSSLLPD